MKSTLQHPSLKGNGRNGVSTERIEILISIAASLRQQWQNNAGTYNFLGAIRHQLIEKWIRADRLSSLTVNAV